MYYIYICVCMCKCASLCVLCICLLIFHTNYSDMCRYKKNVKIRSKIVKQTFHFLFNCNCAAKKIFRYNT